MKAASLIAAVATSACLCAHADKTEYAFRWNPENGGPATAEEAARILGINDDKAKKIEVRYLTVKQPAGLPNGNFQAVARERVDKDGPESMYKVRGPDSKAGRTVLSMWVCPLSGPALETKFEVDVNWAKEHHSLWVEEEQAKASAPPDSPRAVTAE